MYFVMLKQHDLHCFAKQQRGSLLLLAANFVDTLIKLMEKQIQTTEHTYYCALPEETMGELGPEQPKK